MCVHITRSKLVKGTQRNFNLIYATELQIGQNKSILQKSTLKNTKHKFCSSQTVLGYLVVYHVIVIGVCEFLRMIEIAYSWR